MGKRRKQINYFNYECTISGERYKVTKKAKNPDELVNVASYYELNPEEDDRPKTVKKELGILEEE